MFRSRKNSSPIVSPLEPPPPASTRASQAQSQSQPQQFQQQQQRQQYRQSMSHQPQQQQYPYPGGPQGQGQGQGQQRMNSSGSGGGGSLSPGLNQFGHPVDRAKSYDSNTAKSEKRRSGFFGFGKKDKDKDKVKDKDQSRDKEVSTASCVWSCGLHITLRPRSIIQLPSFTACSFPFVFSLYPSLCPMISSYHLIIEVSACRL
jgi:hypothetical protein